MQAFLEIQNIAAVYAILLSLGFMNWKKIQNSIQSFKILPHRLEKVREIDNITFINAYFEAVSGFTSTGFSVFENIKHFKTNSFIPCIVTEC